MQEIEINGIELLNEDEKETANRLLDEYYSKIQRQIKNITSLRVHIKEYNKGGKRKKYSIEIQVISPTRKFKAGAFDWEFARTLHKVLNKLSNEIEHTFHTSEQH